MVAVRRKLNRAIVGLLASIFGREPANCRIQFGYPLTLAPRLIKLRVVRRPAMNLQKFVLPSVLVAAIGLSGCEREKTPALAAAPPQVFVETVEPRDVPIMR